MTKDRCLVIGGSGFLGSHLCQALVSQGTEVNVLSRNAASLSGYSEGLHFFCGSLQDIESVEMAIQGCGLVYHLGSSTVPSTSNLNPKEDINTNLKGAITLIEASIKEQVRKIIFASSGGTVYGVKSSFPIHENASTNPICSYGIVKLAIEKYLHMYFSLYGLDYCVLRIANPFGIGQRLSTKQGVVTVFMNKYLRREKIEIWGDGKVTRDYIYVDDVVSALLKASLYSGESKVFNIGSSVGRSINQVLDSIEMILEVPQNRSYQTARNLDVPCNILDVSLASKELGWAPEISWEDGLRRTHLCLRDLQI